MTEVRARPQRPRRWTMGRIAVHEFITLDDRFDPKMGTAIARVMGACKAILLGRRTYELFAPTWSKRTAAEDPGAPFMNDTPKYVVSSTLSSADWRNTT